jgi:ATP-dependent exoDNAse (exonuclease V) beta subunit
LGHGKLHAGDFPLATEFFQIPVVVAHGSPELAAEPVAAIDIRACSGFADQLLRLDRLVKHRESQTWWVLDYKTSPAPQRIPELQAQLQQYQAAVQQAYPEQPVKAAFITAQGKLIGI